MAQRINWTDDEMIVVLDLYFKIPFGKQHRTNPDVQAVARLINRTDSSVAMRLGNYAACDPYILDSGRHGLSAGRDRCIPFWDRYVDDKEGLFFKAEEIKAKLARVTIESQLALQREDFIGKDRETVIKQRVNQASFRAMVLGNYEHKCALTGIDVPAVLVASHIVPWASDEKNRLNPANGICLSPLCDKLFDNGLLGIREDYTVQLSTELKENVGKDYYAQYIGLFENMKLRLPIEHLPDKRFLSYHYENIFTPHN